MSPQKQTIRLSVIEFATFFAMQMAVMLFRGFVLMKGWNWFVAETFGIQALSLWQAGGLSIVMWAMIGRGTLAEKHYGLEGEPSLSLLVLNQLLNNAGLLAALYLLHRLC